jgi:hypothetical protein
MHYRAVILVICTNDTSYFKNARKVWKSYMNINPSIKVIFVYGNSGTYLEDKDSSDLVYDFINESTVCPGILKKTLIGMAQINKEYTFDYYIQTTISTFWNLYIVEDILNSLPKEKCYAGGHDLSPFTFYYNNMIDYKLHTKHIYSGVCIIITPDIVDTILKNIKTFNFNFNEDLAIGVFMENIEYTPFTIKNAHYYENYGPGDEEKLVEEIKSGIDNNIVYYRVKNTNQRDYTDLMIYKKLLKNIYDIELN